MRRLSDGAKSKRWEGISAGVTAWKPNARDDAPALVVEDRERGSRGLILWPGGLGPGRTEKIALEQLLTAASLRAPVEEGEPPAPEGFERHHGRRRRRAG